MSYIPHPFHLRAIIGKLDDHTLIPFYTYARRVKHLYISDDYPLVEPSTCILLGQLERGLLPSLISIEVNLYNSAPPIHPFFGLDRSLRFIAG